ncbi:hypothetical protein [Ralstonia mannitolilytica]|uniref:hypothetical protein n=1 Tax=Ralstonia mannitolilytica TaxID=105219 RepID=UPI00292FFDAA|nr:hypothetical protein [Ralstonia mannitolilytica]
MEINIEKPFRLHLDVVETDEHVPSMRAQVIIEVRQFGHSLEYRGSLWFDCAVWDAFSERLNSIGEEQAVLVDMGNHFALRLNAIDGQPKIVWEMKKVDVTGGIATATFQSPIDEDTLAHVKNQFMHFVRWW